jgi:hypothetical protein
MFKCWIVWIAVLGLVLGCEAEKSGAPVSDEREPVAPKKAESPAKTGDPGEEAIQITLPQNSTRPNDAESRSSVGSDTVSDSFGPGKSLADCLSNCETRTLSDDNRATCRLLCQSHYARTEKVDRGGLIDSYVGCFDACEGEASCRKRCGAEVGRDDDCATTCLDVFGRCLAPCEGGGDAGGCTERCETAARTCASAC